MNAETLIAQLAADVRPVRRLPSPTRRAALWLAMALSVVAAVVAVNGIRPELMQGRLAVELAAAVATAVAAAWAAFASTVPGAGGWRLALPMVPAAVWLASLGTGCWTEWLAWRGGMAGRLLDPICLPEIVATSLLPIVALVVMARRGASLTPARTGALAALASASLASAGLSLFHEADAAITALVWHFGTVMLLTGLAALAGKALLRPARFP